MCNYLKLEILDQKLIKLLRDRISLQSQSELPPLEEQLSKFRPLLAQFGVPEFVWQSIVISCGAALSAVPSSPAKARPRRVTVIGGHGMMGQFFVKQLSAAGHPVSILEHNDWDHAAQLLGGAELVLVCVPIERALDVIRNATKYLTPATTLADITSVKAPIVQAMLESHKGPVLGLHPLFGPTIKSFLSQNVVVCPGRRKEAFQWFLDLIESKGGKLTVCTPEEHDRMMVVTQAIRHFATFSLGTFLAEAEIGINRSLGFSSPSYRMELSLCV